jgi:hypothetical protein
MLAMAGTAAAAPSATTATADNKAEAARVVLRREPRPRRRPASWPVTEVLFMTVFFDSGTS